MKIKILVIIFTVAGSIFAVNYFSSKDNISEFEIRKELKKFNEKLPARFDEFSWLDSITLSSSDSKELCYHVTVDIYKEEANIDTIQKYITPKILSNIKKNSSLKEFRDNNIIWNYLFYDYDGILFYKYRITPEMYKEKN